MCAHGPLFSFISTLMYSTSSYNVLVKIGAVVLPVVLDTGSADLWILLDSCANNCSHGLPVYRHKSLKYSGVDARLFYGDSTSESEETNLITPCFYAIKLAGTYAFGPIAKDTVALANLSIPSQYFAGISESSHRSTSDESTGHLAKIKRTRALPSRSQLVYLG